MYELCTNNKDVDQWQSFGQRLVANCFIFSIWVQGPCNIIGSVFVVTFLLFEKSEVIFCDSIIGSINNNTFQIALILRNN